MLDDLDHMFRRKFAGDETDLTGVRAGQIHLHALTAVDCSPLHFLVQLVVGVGLSLEGELLCCQVFEGRRLLVGHADRVAGVDLRHETEVRLVALTGGAGEFIDHAARHALDAGAVGRILEFEIVDGAVRNEIRNRDGQGIGSV